MGQTPHNPYATPTAQAHTEAAAPSSMAGSYGAFRDNGALKTALVCLLVLDALFYIVNTGILNYMNMQRYESASYLPTDNTSELEDIISIASLAHALFSIALIVTFLVWVNRSCKNAWLLDPPRMETTPGWAVGYFFIPIIMLWKPYGAMKEIRSASYGKDHPLKTLIPLWWTFSLITLFIGTYTDTLYSSTDLDVYLTACKLDLISTPLNVILNYLVIVLVTGITLAQQRRILHWHQ